MAKKPQVKVDTAPELEPAPQGQANPVDLRASGRRARNAAGNARRQASAWLDGVAPGHGNAVLFGIAGGVVALVILYVGFFQALLIAILVLAGVAFGQWLDGDPVIINALSRLLRSGDNS
ncbi:DUF2273 domain-containing protein [Olsenella sp. YH-ols2217]|uniref:DUF2273 domain-containing protein n=1 Tax=Kribbibacterium absianum TaxID=3044210 RepID=A0ABT6ZLR2_9ACTN|nr:MULTISPECIES: DUF2273 domain-containing protein [unclassified Olsenella]MDJ1121987.1 DUF2273 domain-containing protein [Olsenella sp. YH-ols2216]MDJ1129995.1 DUF2273 domain-containing protein [Olsenella sp. YH-ols2217]